MAVTKSLRYQILRRDNHACRYCGATAPDVKLTVDHVVPQALGGSDDPSNLVTACQPCNSGKSATPADAAVVADVAADALRWKQVMALVLENRMAARQKAEQFHRAFEECWNDYIPDSDPDELFHLTIDNLYAAGLNGAELLHAIQVTAQQPRRDPWKYFCGICWRTLTEIQDVARQVLVNAEAR